MSFLDMFSGLTGQMSTDMAIDLGTANTLVAIPGEGIVVNEPSVVAIEKATHRVLAVGHEAKNMINHTPEAFSAEHPLHDGVVCAMFAVQDVINFVIPSGSGQAAVTMPLMIPLGDLLGINRQVNVLAFQFGDSLSNMVTPAGAKLMAGIAMCNIPYKKWLKFFLPCFALWWIISFILLTIATLINYGPF